MELLQTGSFRPPDSSGAADTIQVVSWNINRGLQLEDVIKFLRRTGADLILLQEADVNARRTNYRNVAREIAQALRMDYVFGCEFEELTQGDQNSPAYHGQATLSRLPLSASRMIRFRTQSDFWRPRWFIPSIHPVLQRRLGARMALISHIACFEKQLVAYNVHLESRGNDALRCNQLVEIIDDVQQYDSEVPVLIAGDFNFDLSRPPATSALAAAPFNNPMNHGNVRPTTTGSRLGRARAIDWILTRGPLEVAEPRLHDSVRASDHYPLSLTLLGKTDSVQSWICEYAL